MTSRNQKPRSGCARCGNHWRLRLNAAVEHDGDRHIMDGWSCDECRAAYAAGDEVIHRQEHPDIFTGAEPAFALASDNTKGAKTHA